MTPERYAEVLTPGTGEYGLIEIGSLRMRPTDQPQTRLLGPHAGAGDLLGGKTNMGGYHVMTEGETAVPTGQGTPRTAKSHQKRGRTLPSSPADVWFWTSSLQNRDRVNVCGVQSPVCGTLLQPLWETNTPPPGATGLVHSPTPP